MYAGDKKKQKSFKDALKKKKKGKKKQKEVDVPKLPRFKELPPIKIKRKGKPKEEFKDPIIPMASLGYKEKTSRPTANLQKGNCSLRK